MVDRPAAPNVVDDEICLGETANLSAGPVSGGTLNWYDSDTGGTFLGTGTLYTDVPTSTTSYWVEEVVPNVTLSVGPPDNTFGTGGYFTANDLRGLFFDAYTDFVLESVRVYSGETSTRTIQILDGDGGSVIHTGDFLIPAGESVVNLNWTISAYSGYYMKITGLPVNLFRINDGSPSYPYTLPGIVSLTGSNVVGSETDYYYYFFDWKLHESDCISERAEVVATVDPLPTVTTSGDVTIVGGTSTGLTSSGGVSYSWSPTTGLDDPSISNPTATPTSTTTYTVTVTDANGCQNTADLTVTVEGKLGLDPNGDLSLLIHPNPAHGQVTIAGRNLSSAYFLEIHATDGKLIYSENILEPNAERVIDLSRHARGIYFLKASGKDFTFTTKLVLE